MTGPRALTERPHRRALVVAHARRKFNLAIGVGGTVGGAVLLGANVTYLALANLPVVPWLPLVANAALILGGAMFLREFSRRAGSSALPRATTTAGHDTASRPADL